MLRAYILIQTKDLKQYSYANKYLTSKSGEDGEGHKKYAGKAGVNYYYTGYGDDTYDDQTELGMAKGDYEYILESSLSDVNDYLQFPEADSDHGAVEEIVRSPVVVKSGLAERRIKIRVEDIVSVQLIEEDVQFPFEELRSNDPHKDDENIIQAVGTSGPIYEILTTDTITVPLIQATISGSTVTITNFDKYSAVYYRKIVDGGFTKLTSNTLSVSDWAEIYGVWNGKKSAIKYVKKTSSGTYTLNDEVLTTEDFTVDEDTETATASEDAEITVDEDDIED